jgi:hypothetical protein
LVLEGGEDGREGSGSEVGGRKGSKRLKKRKRGGKKGERSVAEGAVSGAADFQQLENREISNEGADAETIVSGIQMAADGVASASGPDGVASASGPDGVASASGTDGVASASGTDGVGSASGTKGVASEYETEGWLIGELARAGRAGDGTEGEGETGSPRPPEDWQSPPWSDVAKKIVKGAEKRGLDRLFRDWGDGGKRGGWTPLVAGLAVALGEPLRSSQVQLAKLATGSKGRAAMDDPWSALVDMELAELVALASPGELRLGGLAEGLLWAYALPALIAELRENDWKQLCQGLDRLARQGLAVAEPLSTERLLAGELAIVLRLRLGDLASDTLANQGADQFEAWLDAGDQAVDATIAGGGLRARLTLATVLRQAAIIKGVLGRKVGKRRLGAAVDLATWVLALTRRDGTAVFSTLGPADCKEDTAAGSLFEAIRHMAPKSLVAAINASSGRGHKGNLTWSVGLPESLWHSEPAKLAALLPEWDVRRARVFVDYAQDRFKIEIDHGKGIALLGNWRLTVEGDGIKQRPLGGWVCNCEYSDDDVHYLEFEQQWTGRLKVQRQVLLVREDRCVLLADAVLRDEAFPSCQIDYASVITAHEMMAIQPEDDTNEHWLVDPEGRKRALMLSLQTSEWRVGKSAVKIAVTGSNEVRLQAKSQPPSDNGGGVYAPLWLDFQQRRFERPRTYRQLTVGDELRIVDPDEALAYRIQLGSEHWVVYRTLRGHRPRTFLGKHLIADFHCGRFSPGEGIIDDLVTITSHDQDDEDEDEDETGGESRGEASGEASGYEEE